MAQLFWILIHFLFISSIAATNI